MTPCQVPWGPWAEQYKGQLIEAPAQPPQPAKRPAGHLCAHTLEMKALFLSFGLGLLAALQAQTFPTVDENQDVRPRWEGATRPCHCSSAEGGKQVLYIIPSAVEEHCIFYHESSIYGHRFRMAKLVGRDPDFNQEALEDFQNVVRAEGLNAESIFIPKQSESCPLGNN
nr:von Ebner gland protein 1-like [Meriones unguiculatus]